MAAFGLPLKFWQDRAEPRPTWPLIRSCWPRRYIDLGSVDLPRWSRWPRGCWGQRSRLVAGQISMVKRDSRFLPQRRVATAREAIRVRPVNCSLLRVWLSLFEGSRLSRAGVFELEREGARKWRAGARWSARVVKASVPSNHPHPEQTPPRCFQVSSVGRSLTDGSRLSPPFPGPKGRSWHDGVSSPVYSLRGKVSGSSKTKLRKWRIPYYFPKEPTAFDDSLFRHPSSRVCNATPWRSGMIGAARPFDAPCLTAGPNRPSGGPVTAGKI